MLNSKTISQEVGTYTIGAISGSVAFGNGSGGGYIKTGKHILAYGYLNILNSNNASIVVTLPFATKSTPIVGRAFKGTGTPITCYGESGGLLIGCGTGGSSCYFSVEYVTE